MLTPQLSALLAKGVLMPAPHLVHVEEDIDPSRIAAGVTLHPGAVLKGAKTLLLEGAEVGTEGSTVVEDCALGRNAVLASGSFQKAVFLDGASYGPSGHARAGTLFEEGASAAHATGTKQTILLPFATLGSDVNFCDALLSGGTSSKNHSEVGSGFIHFNFTPHGPAGDKATASVFGDVPRGVWLQEERIFLGGAGGVVGPIQMGYGSVLAAGGVYRRDRSEGVLVLGEKLPPREMAFEPAILKRVGDRVDKTLSYIGQLWALDAFYAVIRTRLAGSDAPRLALIEAARSALRSGVKERVKQLGRLCDGLPQSIALQVQRGGEETPEVRLQRRLLEVREALAEALLAEPEAPLEALVALSEGIAPEGADYLTWVRAVDGAARSAAQGDLEALALEPVRLGARFMV